MNDSKSKQPQKKPSRFQIRFDDPKQEKSFERMLKKANKFSRKSLKTKVK